MEPAQLARSLAAARVVIGTAMTVLPRTAARSWVGRLGNRRAAQLPTAATGARDVGIGAGALAALRSGQGVRPWLLAGAAGDVADLVYTWRAREEVPFMALAGVSLLAAGSASLHAWAAARLD